MPHSIRQRTSQSRENIGNRRDHTGSRQRVEHDPGAKKDIGEKLDAVAKDSRTMGKDFDNVAAERDEYKEDSDTLFHIYIGCGVFVALILLALFLKFRPSILGAFGKVFSGGVAK